MIKLPLSSLFFASGTFSSIHFIFVPEKYGSIIYSYQHDKVVIDPQKHIPNLINWLGWDWDSKYLSPHKSRRKVFTASSSQIRKKIYSNSVGEWSNYEKLLKPAIDLLSLNNIL